MALVNIHMKEKEKKQLQAYINSKEIKSISEFVRQLISEKIKIEEFAKENEKFTDVEIPEYIPQNKYVAFVNGAIAAVGDSPSEVMHEAMLKFPNFPVLIKYKGESEVKPLEYCFMSLEDFHGWHYSQFQNQSYFVLPITLKHEEGETPLTASIDTASTLCLLKSNLIPPEDFALMREAEIYTTGGIIHAQIYTGTVSILDTAFDIEFLMAPISNQLPFEFLIGRNLFDQLDAYFLGKKQLFLLRKASL